MDNKICNYEKEKNEKMNITENELENDINKKVDTNTTNEDDSIYYMEEIISYCSSPTSGLVSIKNTKKNNLFINIGSEISNITNTITLNISMIKNEINKIENNTDILRCNTNIKKENKENKENKDNKDNKENKEINDINDNKYSRNNNLRISLKNDTFRIYNEYKKNLQIKHSEKIGNKSYYLQGGRQIYKSLRKKELDENLKKNIFPSINNNVKTFIIYGDNSIKNHISIFEDKKMNKDNNILEKYYLKTSTNENKKNLLPSLTKRNERQIYINKNKFFQHKHCISSKTDIPNIENRNLTIYDL